MNVNGVDGIEHVLGAPALLIAVGELRDGNWNVEARQVLLREDNLLCELLMGQDVVVKRLRSELDATRDELGQRIRVQCRE